MLHRFIRAINAAITFIALGSAAMPSQAGEQTVTYLILGLASPDRQDDLREDLKAVANVELVSIAYDQAQCTLRFDVAKIKAGENYAWFCSFPGHSTLMKGTLALVK